MVRSKDPRIRSILIERAAQMLADREPVTLRALVKGTSVSTMAVYTYFDGLEGLWKALRQEGFTRLSARLALVEETSDPIRDLSALGSAYLLNGLESPDLYRVMFDATFDLEDPVAADAGLQHLVGAASRARDQGRIRSDVDPLDLATQTWIVGHGLVSLVATGPLPDAVLGYGIPMLTALFVAAGDDPVRCRRSVKSGWSI
ncbi:TetR/AcrR family transcriptional regulator [Rhodococcus sp. P1Y]|uniref:TetR/AcrR family transcriptional regulator n=1 Tax=Rhodococcus sp. P1Y TaxID=1302308 RepID=UPI00191497B8|nr:TetR/AcrR family transcriptional regulator [Rhodococcus sp. P1Y]